MLAVVADKTGYPPDMLDLDLDLEADLGIDTVKQAEVFALIRERFGIERDDKLKLRDYPTLTHVIALRPRTRRGRPEPKPEPVEPEPVVTRALAGAAGGGRRTWRARCWRWWPTRPVTPPTCWTSIWIWRPTWASTRSSRPRCSP